LVIDTSAEGFAPIAQLDRALASGAKGRRFESCWAHQYSLNSPLLCGPVAQLAEQQTLNLLVEGSIPSGLTSLRSNA
jgi:hypothetical protein